MAAVTTETVLTAPRTSAAHFLHVISTWIRVNQVVGTPQILWEVVSHVLVVHTGVGEALGHDQFKR